jgi:hypothetical protein
MATSEGVRGGHSPCDHLLDSLVRDTCVIKLRDNNIQIIDGFSHKALADSIHRCSKEYEAPLTVWKQASSIEPFDNGHSDAAVLLTFVFSLYGD